MSIGAIIIGIVFLIFLVMDYMDNRPSFLARIREQVKKNSKG